MKLVVGLGNPGKQYAATRHNIGFVLVQDFVQREKLGVWKTESKWKGLVLKAVIGDQEVIFLKPQEFMNRSGGAVHAVATFYKIAPQDILVIHDDIDLPVGKVQLKLGGSSAGHNGLKDIILKLETKDFWRLRIGVDRPINQQNVADYVLGKFSPSEQKVGLEHMAEVHEYIKSFLEK